MLDTFAGNIARNGRVFVLAGNLVDFVDIYDPLLALLLISPRVLEQLEDDILDVLAHVPCLCQGRGVNDRERNGQHLCQRLRQQSFACSCGTNQQNIALLKLQVAPLLRDLQPLVVIVDCDRQLFLGRLLTDYIQVDELLDFLRFGELLSDRRSHDIIGDDLIAHVHALVAYVDSGAGDEFLNVVLAFRAERASQDIIAFIVFSQRRPPTRTIEETILSWKLPGLRFRILEPDQLS